MKFIEALKELEKGKKIKRNFWKGCYYKIENSKILFYINNETKYPFGDSSFDMVKEEIEAEDWEVVENQSLIEIILEGIREIEKKIAICPNTIRINPNDYHKLKEYVLKPCYAYDIAKIDRIFNLKIIKSTKVQEGTAEIYNDKCFVEVNLK